MTQENESSNIERVNPAEWSIAQLRDALTVQQLWKLLGGLVVLVVGAFSLGCWLGGAFSGWWECPEPGINATFIEDRGLAYKTAIRMVREIGKSETVTKNILNIRATANVPEQDELYNTIYSEIKKGEILFTRATTYESDPDLSVTRRFLEELGEEKNVRMVMIFGSPYIQGGLITNSEAILGFRATDGTVNHALHIKGPDLLVQDIQTMYKKALKNGVHTYQIKSFDEVIPAADIPRVIDEYKEKIQR